MYYFASQWFNYIYIYCGSIAAISKENAGEIPDVKMDKKYVNPKAVKETEIITAKKCLRCHSRYLLRVLK